MVQRDVLGVTRGAVPILARSGVDALTVGCNGAGAPPGVPKNQPFLWRDEGSGTEIVAMWHAGLHPLQITVLSSRQCSTSLHGVPACFWQLVSSNPAGLHES